MFFLTAYLFGFSYVSDVSRGLATIAGSLFQKFAMALEHFKEILLLPRGRFNPALQARFFDVTNKIQKDLALAGSFLMVRCSKLNKAL